LVRTLSLKRNRSPSVQAGKKKGRLRGGKPGF
jgi:hypothetical protein